MKYRSALNTVRGLGSARSGTHHWWMQRVTAVALVPLMVWLCISIARMGGMGYEGALVWLNGPVNAVLLISCLAVLFYHGRLGMQVVVEDYLHGDGAKVMALMGLNFITALFGLAAILAVLRVYLSG